MHWHIWPPGINAKRHTWTLLRRLAGLFNYPWLCFGDFNEILNLNEKLGGNDRCLNMVAEFREAVTDCSLVDLEVTPLCGPTSDMDLI